MGNGPETERKLALEGQLLSQNHLQLSLQVLVPAGFGKGGDSVWAIPWPTLSLGGGI